MGRSELLLFLDSCLSCCYTCDWHTEWRARYVVETYSMAELHTTWLTTMLTADTYLKVGIGTATKLGTVLNELSYTLLIEYLEWVDWENLLCKIIW